MDCRLQLDGIFKIFAPIPLEPTTNQPANDTGSDIVMESEDEEAAMAAVMGFSGFGKAPATKKRKYNSKTDAFIEGQELQDIDKGGRKGQGSGGNEVPLGRMRVLAAPSTQEEQSEPQQKNEDEIDLDMGEGYEDEDRPMEERCLDTSRPPPADEKVKNDARRMERRGKPLINEDEIMLDDDDDDDEKAAPAQPTTAETASQEAQCKIDAIVAASVKQPSSTQIPKATEAPVPKPKQKKKQKQKPEPAQGLAAFMTALQTPVVSPPSIPPRPGTTSAATIITPTPGTATTAHTYATPKPFSLPQRPPQSAPASSHVPSPANSTAGGGRGGGRGQRNELWYVEYYDPSFNENPWKQLEKEHGLPSVGTWLERPRRNQQHDSA